MKKFFAALPMIGLILGTVVLATEIRKPSSVLESVHPAITIQQPLSHIHKKSSLFTPILKIFTSETVSPLLETK